MTPNKPKSLFKAATRRSGVRVGKDHVRQLMALEYEAYNQFGELQFFIADVRALHVTEAKFILSKFLSKRKCQLVEFLGLTNYGPDRSWLEGDSQTSYRSELINVKVYCRETLEGLRKEAAKNRGLKSL